MTDRRSDGRETWHRLLEWDKGSTASERLAARLLSSENYSKIDPSHPLGGKDGGKDAFLEKDGLRLILAVYFPRGQQTIKEITDKFRGDLEGVEKNKTMGIVFFTNQELTLSERQDLVKIANDKILDLYHLERITTLLDVPKHYGLRLEFLEINMRHEEMLAFYAQRDEEYLGRLLNIYSKLDSSVKNIIGYTTGGDSFLGIEVSVEFIVFHVFGNYPLKNILIKTFDLQREEQKKALIDTQIELLINEKSLKKAELIESLIHLLKMEFIYDEGSIVATSPIPFLDNENSFVIDAKKFFKRTLEVQKYYFEVISDNGISQINLIAQYTANFLEVTSEVVVKKGSIILRKTKNNIEIPIES
jgi:hypothetical protein